MDTTTQLELTHDHAIIPLKKSSRQISRLGWINDFVANIHYISPNIILDATSSSAQHDLSTISSFSPLIFQPIYWHDYLLQTFLHLMSFILTTKLGRIVIRFMPCELSWML